MAGLLAVFSGAKTAIYVAIGTAVVALGVYAWYEGSKVDSLNQQLGQAAKTIVDDNAQIAADNQALVNWKNAFAEYQLQAKNQADAYDQALSEKETLDAKLQTLTADLLSDPTGAARAINAYDDTLVGLLKSATGAGGSAAAATTVAPDSAATGAR